MLRAHCYIVLSSFSISYNRLKLSLCTEVELDWSMVIIPDSYSMSTVPDSAEPMKSGNNFAIS